jgi:hypothetical protein
MLNPEIAPLSSVKLDAQDVVYPVFLDPQVPPVRTVAPDALVSLVPPDSLDAHHQSARNPHRHHATLAHLDHPDQPDPPALPETPVVPALLVAMETMVPLVLPDHRDLPALLATQDQMVNLETLAPPLTLNLSSLETLAHKEILAHKVFLETLAPLVPMDNLATPDQKDHLAHQDQLDLLATMVNLDHVDPPVLRENAVCAPNIAPWMVVFSSKMEQGDKISAAQIFLPFFKFFVFFNIAVVLFVTSDKDLSRERFYYNIIKILSS